MGVRCRGLGVGVGVRYGEREEIGGEGIGRSKGEGSRNHAVSAVGNQYLVGWWGLGVGNRYR